MPFDPSGAIESAQRTLGLVPAAILAIIFLAGPTLAWLLYRFVVRPHSSRYASDGDDLLWLCSRCRSANAIRSKRCYRCGLAQAEIEGELKVVDGDTIVALGSHGEIVGPDADPSQPVAAPPPPPPMIAVGPGRAPSFPRADIRSTIAPGAAEVASVPDADDAPIASTIAPPTTTPATAPATTTATSATNGATAPRKVRTAERKATGPSIVAVGPGPTPGTPALEPAVPESAADPTPEGTSAGTPEGASGPAAARPAAAKTKTRGPRTRARSSAAKAGGAATAVVEPPLEEA